MWTHCWQPVPSGQLGSTGPKSKLTDPGCQLQSVPPKSWSLYHLEQAHDENRGGGTTSTFTKEKTKPRRPKLADVPHKCLVTECTMARAISLLPRNDPRGGLPQANVTGGSAR